MKHETAPAFALLLPLIVPLWFGFILWLLSRLGGWARLAATYPPHTLPYGRKMWVAARVGWVNYNGCLRVWVGPEGMFLSLIWPFSIFHKPLFIPWSAIRNRQDHKMLWVRTTRFDIGDPRITTMQLPTKVFEAREGGGM